MIKLIADSSESLRFLEQLKISVKVKPEINDPSVANEQIEMADDPMLGGFEEGERWANVTEFDCLPNLVRSNEFLRMSTTQQNQILASIVHKIIQRFEP